MGAFWWDEQEGLARQTAPAVRNFLLENPFYADLLGIEHHPPPLPGTLVPQPPDPTSKQWKTSMLSDMQPSPTIFPHNFQNQHIAWQFGQSFITHNGDCARTDAHVIFEMNNVRIFYSLTRKPHR